MRNIIRANDVQLSTSSFYGRANLKTANLRNVPFRDNCAAWCFEGCPNLTSVYNINQNVTNMYGMYQYCTNLADAPEIPNSVTTTGWMFYGCSNLVNAPTIPNSVTNAITMFSHCTNMVDAPVIPNSVTNMAWTFEDCHSLINVPTIPNSVTTMQSTFMNCTSLVDAPEISNSVTFMPWLFKGCSNLVNAPAIPNSVTNMWSVFYGCSNLVNVPSIPNSIIDMSWGFYGCSNLVNVPDMSNATKVAIMYQTFHDCSLLNTVSNIPNSVINMVATFQNCVSLVNVSSIPNNLTNMWYTFHNCTSLTNIPPIPNTVTNMGCTFFQCPNLTGNIIIKSNKIYYAYNCFSNTSLTKNVYIPFRYENGVNTVTYNSFVAAGYDNAGTSCGVYLKDLSNTCEVTINVNQFGTDNVIYVDNVKLSDNVVNCIYGTHNITVATKEEGLYEGTFDVTIDEMGSSKAITINMTSSGSRLKISGTIDGMTVETDTTMSYEDSFGNLITFKTSSLAVKENTNVTYKAEYVYNGDAYIASGTQVVSGVVNLVLPLTLVQDENVDLVYPFDQNYLTITKSLTQYEVNSTLQALVSGSSSYHVDNGTSYGSIKFRTGTDNLTLTVTGYVSSESNWDYGAVYIGTSEYKPTQSQLKSGTTDGNGAYILRSSGIGTSTTYTYTLQPNTEYYLSLAYAKDSSGYNGEDRLIIQEIKFTSVATKRYKIDVENYDIQYIDDTNIILTSYTGGGTDVKVPEPVWR